MNQTVPVPLLTAHRDLPAADAVEEEAGAPVVAGVTPVAAGMGLGPHRSASRSTPAGPVASSRRGSVGWRYRGVSGTNQVTPVSQKNATR